MVCAWSVCVHGLHACACACMVCTWPAHIHAWFARVCAWSVNVSALSACVCAWSVHVCAWSACVPAHHQFWASAASGCIWHTGCVLSACGCVHAHGLSVHGVCIHAVCTHMCTVHVCACASFPARLPCEAPSLPRSLGAQRCVSPSSTRGDLAGGSGRRGKRRKRSIVINLRVAKQLLVGTFKV